MRKKLIWIVDAEQWPRAYLRGLLIERGLDAVGFIDLPGALSELRNPRSVKPHLIVIELRGLTPAEDEIEALILAGIPLIGIAGAMEINEEWVKKVRWSEIFRRPMTIDEIAGKIKALLAGSSLV